MEKVRETIHARPPHVTFGGWGQDGHIAYNQARRHPYARADATLPTDGLGLEAVAGALVGLVRMLLGPLARPGASP